VTVRIGRLKIWERLFQDQRVVGKVFIGCKREYELDFLGFVLIPRYFEGAEIWE
jgi:hypothetical protein